MDEIAKALDNIQETEEAKNIKEFQPILQKKILEKELEFLDKSMINIS